MCYIDGQKNKYSVLNGWNRMLKCSIQYIHYMIFMITNMVPCNIMLSNVVDVYGTTLCQMSEDKNEVP
jgi:hypothetical protein